MTQSPTISALAKALVSFQREMNTVVYDADNPFYKSKYATLAALVSESRELLTKNGLAISQMMDGECSVTTMLMHESGEFISGTLSLKAVKGYKKHPMTGEPILEEYPTPQAFGAAITYSRRYSYAAILGLVSDKDDDGNEASGLKAEPKAVDLTALLPSMKERIIAEGKKKFKSPDEFQAWRVDHKLAENLSTATESQLTYIWAVLRELK